jgi:hypothetical protein
MFLFLFLFTFNHAFTECDYFVCTTYFNFHRIQKRKIFERSDPARQAPEIIHNEYSINTENAYFKCLGKDTTRYFTQSKYTWFLWFWVFFFKTVFGMFLAHPVCVKSVKYKMSRSFKVLSQGILWSHTLKRLLGV